jgi:hypothetical protein
VEDGPSLDAGDIENTISELAEKIRAILKFGSFVPTLSIGGAPKTYSVSLALNADGSPMWIAELVSAAFDVVANVARPTLIAAWVARFTLLI